MNPHTRRFKRFVLFLKSSFLYLILLIFFIILLYLNFALKVRNINITFFDNETENQEIKKIIESNLRQRSNTLYGYLFLDEGDMTEAVHREYQAVSKVKISKSFTLDLNVVVTKNEEFFYTCMSDESGFLARCMLGNTDGEYYQGIDFREENATSSEINIEINPKVLYDVITSKKIESPDSLSGARIYTKEDFKVLREMILWVKKNGFTIRKVYIDELKTADIYTDLYIIKISLDKGYVETVKDFELISRTGDLQKYINEDKEKIAYIDLSYKNKVFYKLKNTDISSFENATTSGIMSTTSSSTSY